MKILIVGGGGREHALAWKCAEPLYVEKVFCAPGNAGTAKEDKVINVAIPSEDLQSLASFAEEENIGLTIVGPEAPLVSGISNTFNARGLKCFGPTKEASVLEGSKVFTKDFLHRHGIPTGRYKSFTDISEALKYIKESEFPLVIKADGLASGKGVFITSNLAEAEGVVRTMIAGNKFGEAGSQIVIEEFLEGEEVSYICMTDGYHCVPFASSQDHKARDDGDLGPNTGGMGAYSPAPLLDSELEHRVLEEIIYPTLSGLREEGRLYKGFLYAGLMIDAKKQPKVLEFNCRFGDPEAQPTLFRLKTDLVDACLKTLEGRAGELQLEFDPKTALGVVLAAKGYPESYQRGWSVKGVEKASGLKDLKIFHAGTALSGSDVVSTGGRVLCVVGLGDNVREAQNVSYQGVSLVESSNLFYRSDIGHRAIARLKSL